MALIKEELTFFEFAQKFLNLNDMSTPQNIDIESMGIEIETMFPDGSIGFSPMTSFVVKDAVSQHWKLGDLRGSSEHRVLCAGEWTSLSNHPDAVLVDEHLHIVDTSVEGTENYLANGHVNHNTVPGGNAIPFHSSVRIKLGAGSQIKGANDTVLGINVSAKTIKNKVAPPFRTANFRIIFGKGIEEHEEIFDLLRAHGPDIVNDHQVEIEGTGAWKHFTVVNEKNEMIIDKKFYKADFLEIMNEPKHKDWIDGLLEKAMTKISIKASDVDIDPESYEEVRSIADQLTESGYDISPA